MITIEADVQKAQDALAGTSKSLAAIERKTLSIVASGTVKAVKGGIRETLNSRTGELLRLSDTRYTKTELRTFTRTEKAEAQFFRKPTF